MDRGRSVLSLGARTSRRGLLVRKRHSGPDMARRPVRRAGVFRARRDGLGSRQVCAQSPEQETRAGEKGASGVNSDSAKPFTCEFGKGLDGRRGDLDALVQVVFASRHSSPGFAKRRRSGGCTW